jgi:hypothetical protein
MLYLDHRRHLVPDKWYGGTSQTFSKTHVKERCGGGGVSGMGCGLWKTKGQPCPHCETRPNRSQAKLAQAMHRVSDRNDKWGFRDPTPEKRPSSAAGMTQEIMNEYLYSGDGPKASLHRRSSAGSRDRLMVHTPSRTHYRRYPYPIWFTVRNRGALGGRYLFRLEKDPQPVLVKGIGGRLSVSDVKRRA